MINIAISLAVALVLGLGSSLAVGAWGAVLPATVGFFGTLVFLWRKTQRQITAAMQSVQRELQKGGQKPNLDKAVERLEAIKAAYGKRQLFVESGIDGQIGVLLFAQGKTERARPYLERAMAQAWEAKLMLAVLQYKKKEMGAVDASLEKVVRLSGKQGLLWSTWAYLHWKSGNRERAIELLNRGRDVLKDADPTLSANLLALQNNKKMKMKPYGDPWYALGLEQHPMLKQAQRGGVRFARR